MLILCFNPLKCLVHKVSFHFLQCWCVFCPSYVPFFSLRTSSDITCISQSLCIILLSQGKRFIAAICSFCSCPVPVYHCHTRLYDLSTSVCLYIVFFSLHFCRIICACLMVLDRSSVSFLPFKPFHLIDVICLSRET